MRAREVAWYLAPGFSIIAARNAFCELGIMALDTYSDAISVRQRKGWKRVRLTITGKRERP